jgi:site-specific DNA recombinase
MPTAGVSARKSNEERGKDAEKKSVAVQVAEAKRYAEKKGWRFLDEHTYVDDAVSGAVETRPGLSALLAAIESKPFDILIVSEQSRLARDTFFTLTLIKRIEETGVAIHGYLDDAPITLADETDEVKEFVRAWANSAERRKTGQRSRTVARRVVEAGRRAGGKLYGYQDINGTPHPEQAAVVERIFQERAKGRGLYVIARGLERDGIKPVRGKGWYVSQVQSIVRNPTYNGVLRWGAEHRVKRRGKIVYEKSPENIITKPAEQYRLVSDKLWSDANAISDASAANTWRDAAGRLKSRATKSPFLLSPFIACECGSPMHAKQSGKGDKKRWLYTCTRHHLLGNKACANGRGIRVEWLDRAVLDTFEEALVGHVVLTQLQEVLGEQQAKAIDPEPLQAEAKKLKAEIKRLVDGLASGDLADIHDAVRARKARLEHLEGTLSGLGAVKEFDLVAFAEKVTPVIADWREHLRKNNATAAQVLRKLIPNRLTVVPQAGGGWSIKGDCDYSAVLKECGLSAVEAVLTEVANLKGSRARRAARSKRRTG